ncbi:MAG: MFS transporter [Planctomycetes bacterium]|nr:MFS transporter [Planctomycetota bacterium]
MTEPKTDALKPLLVAQFTGAFNDNAWKMIVTFLLLATLGGGGPDQAAAQGLTTQAFLVFSLPLVLFSLPAAWLADRIAKDRIIRWMKALEILLMTAGAAVLLWRPEGGWPALTLLGLMGAQSAIFSPAKYGIIPELVARESIVAANGILELMTFLAIILGTGLGGLLLEASAGHPALAGSVLGVVALVGYLAARRLPALGRAADRPESFRAALRGGRRAILRDRALLQATLASAFCWLILALLGQDILVYTKNELALGDGLASLPPALFGLGLGLGALLAGRLAGRSGGLGLLAPGAGIAGLLLAGFGLSAPRLVATMALAGFIGVATGLVIVPLDSLIQRRAPRKRRGAVIAIGNVVVFTAMLFGSLLTAGLAALGLSALQILLVAAGLAAIGALWSFLALPAATLRLLLHGLFRLLHGARFRGLERIPDQGPALLCPNHVSFLDWAYVALCSERPIRFLVDRSQYEGPIRGRVLRAAGAIPISASEGPRVLLAGLRRAAEALDRGELVCLFPEGELSRTGDLLPFRRGFLRLVEGREVPVLPIAISGLEQSRFARGPRGLRRPRPVLVRVGEAMTAPEPSTLRAAVLGLLAQNEAERARELPPLHDLVLRRARSAPFGRAWIAEDGGTTSWARAAAGGLVLARRLRTAAPTSERIAILLPPSPAAALTNLAVALGGRVAINLNYSAGSAAQDSALEQSGRPPVVTSRLVLDRLAIALPATSSVLFLEDLLAEVGPGERLLALLQVLLRGRRAVERLAGAPRAIGAADLATIIFSSGSTGEPKGVMLSHGNVAWDLGAALRRAPLGARDVFLCCLPPFHSFGYLSLWLAAAAGMATAFQANPLDAAAVGRIAMRERATLVMATPSFLQLWMKRCEAGAFASLKLVVAGAERLRPELAAAFERQFGLRPLEGYGATECAPVIAMSGPDARAERVYQPGSRPGSVGRPLVGIEIMIVDPESHAPLPIGEAGLVLMRGPNLMMGYLGRPDLDEAALAEGWYRSGDVGRLDDEGFLTITDRLARFAKIGGEMVPHGRIEEALQAAARREERLFAVTSLPDPNKGESLAVLHTLAEEEIPGLIEGLRAAGLPNLFIPKAERFYRVDDLPLLGSGKLDLARVKEVASRLAAA